MMQRMATLAAPACQPQQQLSSEEEEEEAGDAEDEEEGPEQGKGKDPHVHQSGQGSCSAARGTQCRSSGRKVQE